MASSIPYMVPTQFRSRIHECTILLRFLGIIVWVLRLEVSIYIVIVTKLVPNHFGKLLEVPEIFYQMDSRDFYTIKLAWAGDFGTVIKDSKLFRFRQWYWSFFWECMLSLRYKSLLFGYFLLVLKSSNFFFFFFYCKLSMRRHFLTACPACVAHFLSHVQHA